MLWRGVSALLLLLGDVSHAFVLPQKTTKTSLRRHIDNKRDDCGLKFSQSEDFSYSILATATSASSTAKLFSESTTMNGASSSEEASEPAVENSGTTPIPTSITSNDETTSAAAARPPAPKSHRIVLQESTFSSTSEPTVRRQAPTQQYTTMLKPRVSSFSSSAGTAVPKVSSKQSYFIVNDEMGRPIHPAPTSAPKGLFEVRNEMGEIITPPAPTRKAPQAAPLPTESNAKTTTTQEYLHIQDEDGTTIAPLPVAIPKAALPKSGLSRFTETQQLFTVSGVSTFGVSNEILQLHGRSRRRPMRWNDLNDNTATGRYDGHQEPIRVTEESLNGGPRAEAPVAESLPAAAPVMETPPVPAQDTTEAPLESVPEIPEASAPSAPKEEDPELFFIVKNEMGQPIHPKPKPAPKGLFEVRDEMGRVINTPLPTTAAPKQQVATATASHSELPKSGLAKFAATKELFKVSGMSEFGIPSEMRQL